MPDQPTPTDRRALTSAANGRRSRGPVTPAGKAASRFNAIKHGIHASRLLITRGASPESADELTRLYAQFHEEFAPVGIAEELLLERLFVTYWRMRRILHGETALFADAADDDLTAMVNRIYLQAAAEHGYLPPSPADAGNTPAPAIPAPPADTTSPEPPTFNPTIIDRVTRHEGPLEKAFYRALRELLDLQSRRHARQRRQPDRPTATDETETTK